MSEVEIIATLTLIFAVASVLLLVASRYSLPTVPLYLLAGVVVGGFVDETQLLDLAQWGIAFLVFAFAVHLEPLEEGGLEADSVLVAVGQLVVTGGIMYAVGLGLGFDELNAVYFAIAGTFSSSLVALSLLERRIRLRSVHERLAESIHFVEDVAAILVVLLLSAFVYADASVVVLLAGFGMILVGFAIRYTLFGLLTDFAEGDVEILMLTGVSLIIGFIAIAEFTGVSIVVGAFAAGLAVDSTYPHDVEVIDAIGSLEDFFTPIFFVTLGALVSIPSLSAVGSSATLELVGVGAVLVASVVLLNPILTYAILRWREYDSRAALLTGLSLDQVSEFALIIAIEALAAERIAPELFDAIVLAAIVTMFVSTLTHQYGDDAYHWLVRAGLVGSDRETIAARSRVADDLSDHVIVTGYDREGQQIVDACESAGQPYVVIESDPLRRETVRDHCENYVFGDTMLETTWEIARAERAALIVATVPRQEWAERVLTFDVAAETIVRAGDVESGAALLEQGAVFVAIPDELAADQLRAHVEQLLAGDESREELQERFRARLEQAVEYGPSDVTRIR
ncbi:cation:proton antiporter [Natronoglomus mannanivorans]|uniref:Cation:proton antiporter n=1 Tax=Natronoglomus mannanivorans TaxID=2979990 RepID=A0AAP3E087_9EURY|nr:cation:proton antiporter [Halobacteria archaeon AArc-xg1-1]